MQSTDRLRQNNLHPVVNRQTQAKHAKQGYNKQSTNKQKIQNLIPFLKRNKSQKMREEQMMNEQDKEEMI